MPYRTLVESDGKTVYILSRNHPGEGFRIWGRFLLWILVIGLFGWVVLELTQKRGGLLLSFLLIRFAAYPVLRRVSRSIMTEEVQLNTRQLVSRRTYGFIRFPKHTERYRDGQLFTGSEPTIKDESLIQVAWFTNSPDDSKDHQIIYRHFFPMTPADYETIKAYVQEIFDLDAHEEFELLFSAN
jgi:hypothetical protein